KAFCSSALVTLPSPSASSLPNSFCWSRERPPVALDCSCALISALIAPRLNGGPELPPDGCVWPLEPADGSSPNDDIGSLALGCSIGSVLGCWIDCRYCHWRAWEPLDEPWI